MKKSLLLLILLSSISVFSQKISQEQNLANAINLEPTEVVSSAVLKLNFESAEQLTYKIYINSEIISEHSISKSRGIDVRKVDFSTLATGSYILKFYLDEIEIKAIPFVKI